MNLLFSSSLILSITTMTVVDGAGLSYGVMNTCEEQAGCLDVIINEIDAKCGSFVCEYEVCWQQFSISRPGCNHGGDVQYLSDMHKAGDTELTVDGGCLNEENEDGKGYWDNECTDPELGGYSSGVDYQSTFSGFCQIVAPGETVHLLVNNGQECSGEGTIVDSTQRDITAHCLPSTQDPTSTTGQTFFPATDGGEGGTCSDKAEGYECVWAVTVPSACNYEEGSFSCDTSVVANEEDICVDDYSVLNYYEQEKNAAPPIVPIHDINLNGDGTVTFRVTNPFEDDTHDIYTVYHEAADDGNEQCNQEVAATSCPSDTALTAFCLDDGKYTVVTIFATSSDDTGAAELVADANSDGNEIYKCCPTADEDAIPAHTAAWTYVIYCECPEDASELQDRALRVQVSTLHEELAGKFHRGELFDEQTKKLYGLN